MLWYVESPASCCENNWMKMLMGLEGDVRFSIIQPFIFCWLCVSNSEIVEIKFICSTKSSCFVTKEDVVITRPAPGISEEMGVWELWEILTPSDCIPKGCVINPYPLRIHLNSQLGKYWAQEALALQPCGSKNLVVT